MVVRFNHTILPARDAQASAAWLAELLGLAPPRFLAPFFVVDLADHASVDYIGVGDDHPGFGQHLAFLVDEATFDAVIGRIRERGLRHWADPHMHLPDRINHHDGGRGVYVDDPDGNHLECITRPYGRPDVRA